MSLSHGGDEVLGCHPCWVLFLQNSTSPRPGCAVRAFHIPWQAGVGCEGSCSPRLMSCSVWCSRSICTARAGKTFPELLLNQELCRQCKWNQGVQVIYQLAWPFSVGFKWGWLCLCCSAEFCAGKMAWDSLRAHPEPFWSGADCSGRLRKGKWSPGRLWPPLLHLPWSFEPLAEILSNPWNSYNFPAFCSNTLPLPLAAPDSFSAGQAWTADAPCYQAASTIGHVGSAHQLLGIIPICSHLPAGFWCCRFAAVAIGGFSSLRLFVLFFSKVNTCRRKGVF